MAAIHANQRQFVLGVRQKKKYDKPVESFTNDQKVIEELSKGSKGTTLEFKRIMTYTELLDELEMKLDRDQKSLEQSENRLRVLYGGSNELEEKHINTWKQKIKILYQQIDNARHNAELDLIKPTTYMPKPNLLKVISLRDPVLVTDASGKIHPVYYTNKLKILGTGDEEVPRLGVTFAELGITPVHIYGTKDSEYSTIKDLYLRQT